MYSTRAFGYLFGIYRYNQITFLYSAGILSKGRLVLFVFDFFFLLHLQCKLDECQNKSSGASLGKKTMKGNCSGTIMYVLLTK